MGGPPAPPRSRGGVRRPRGPPVKYHYSHRFFTDPVRRGGEPRGALASGAKRPSRACGRARPAPGTVPGGEFDWGGTPVKR